VPRRPPLSAWRSYAPIGRWTVNRAMGQVKWAPRLLAVERTVEIAP
jgi:hypothetical protein